MLHSENLNIKQLFPLVTESLSKAMASVGSGAKSYTASALEKYAQDIFSRVAEIDNAFKSMSITLEYLGQKNYPNSGYQFSEHHTFHIENFLLRLTSVVDRAYLLAGSTMLMENSKIEKLGGRNKVHNELASFSPKSAEILSKMEEAIEHLRVPRNKVAHQAGFSSQGLTVLQTIENAESELISVKKITDIMSYEEIKQVVIEESIDKFKMVLSRINDLMKELIDSLSFVYSGLLNLK